MVGEGALTFNAVIMCSKLETSPTVAVLGFSGMQHGCPFYAGEGGESPIEPYIRPCSLVLTFMQPTTSSRLSSV